MDFFIQIKSYNASKSIPTAQPSIIISVFPNSTMTLMWRTVFNPYVTSWFESHTLPPRLPQTFYLLELHFWVLYKRKKKNNQK